MFLKFFIKTFVWISVISFLPLSAISQGLLENSRVNGSFQMDVQSYLPDEQLGITDSVINGEKLAMNGFGYFNYTLGSFRAGLRFESYLKPMAGFDREYDGVGIPYWFANYYQDEFDITAGHFYEQFGNGLVLRTYEEWSLGFDNSLLGLRVKYHSPRGVSLTAVYGVQRLYWVDYKPDSRGIVRGLDGEVQLNDLVKGWQNSKTRLVIGGSIVSKYQKDDPTFLYKLPENVASFAGRFTLTRGNFSFQGEYANKINDPSATNNYIYKNGQALFWTTSYSVKGFGVTLGSKWIDNMSFKSDRNVQKNVLDINFLPPLTKQHAYTLEAMYPYASQPNGEFDVMAQVIYTIPKKTKVGGKYGATIAVNYAMASSINKTQIDDTTAIGKKGTLGYKTSFYGMGDKLYFSDFDIEIRRKFSSKFKTVISYMNVSYNQEVLEGHGGMVHANVGVADLTFMFTSKKSLRMELQYLHTQQDEGNWGIMLLEYTIAPKWFFTVQDQYNFNNPEGKNPVHYYYTSIAYIKNTTRIALSYGRQREGLLCVGGVCRQVPAASGFMLTVTSSF